MDDVAQAEQAIQKLDGHEFHGLRLTVQKSTSRGRQQAGMGNRDMYFRFGPGERGGHSFGNRYDPYPPPPPPRYTRDRMLRFRVSYKCLFNLKYKNNCLFSYRIMLYVSPVRILC